MTKADERYVALMGVTATVKVPVGPRLYWRAVVKVNQGKGSEGITRSHIEWHSARCDAPANDCHSCEPC